jgi:hypothetical protein
MNSVAPTGTGSLVAMIVSGGQTGADRAALDWAIETGIPHGGWCPRGRRSEDGKIPDRYLLKETQGTQYAQRTEWNVRDSDGTVIFTIDPDLRGGVKRTVEFAREYRKPWLHLCQTVPIEACVERLLTFLHDHRIGILNVAGSRGSEEPDVGAFVHAVLAAVWDSLRQPAKLAGDQVA